MTVCALWKKPFSDPSHLLPFTKLATGDGLFYQSPARHRRAMSLCPADHSHCFFSFPRPYLLEHSSRYCKYVVSLKPLLRHYPSPGSTLSFSSEEFQSWAAKANRLSCSILIPLYIHSESSCSSEQRRKHSLTPSHSI